MEEEIDRTNTQILRPDRTNPHLLSQPCPPVVYFRFAEDGHAHAATFEMAKETLKRYPDSRLAKLVKQYPAYVGRGLMFFVDRDPKSFNWIREIYRDGDFKSRIPDMSKEMLQKDLNFYMLPSLSDLGLDEVVDQRDVLFASETAGRSLMDQILNEIEASGLKDMFPWRIFVYHKLEGENLDPVRRVFIGVPEGLDSLLYVQQRGHEEFHATLTTQRTHFCRPERDRLVLKNGRTDARFVVTEAKDAISALLRTEANKLGLRVWGELFSFFDANGREFDFNICVWDITSDIRLAFPLIAGCFRTPTKREMSSSSMFSF